MHNPLLIWMPNVVKIYKSLRKQNLELLLLLRLRLGREPLDHNGFCLWHKRLEKDRFLWPETEEGVLNVHGRELTWLLDGLSIDQREAHQRVSYKNVI